MSIDNTDSFEFTDPFLESAWEDFNNNKKCSKKLYQALYEYFQQSLENKCHNNENISQLLTDKQKKCNLDISLLLLNSIMNYNSAILAFEYDAAKFNQFVNFFLDSFEEKIPHYHNTLLIKKRIYNGMIVFICLLIAVAALTLIALALAALIFNAGPLLLIAGLTTVLFSKLIFSALVAASVLVLIPAVTVMTYACCNFFSKIKLASSQSEESCGSYLDQDL